MNDETDFTAVREVLAGLVTAIVILECGYDQTGLAQGLRDTTRNLCKLRNELEAITAERDALRDQLQRIGRKAFWAAREA